MVYLDFFAWNQVWYWFEQVLWAHLYILRRQLGKKIVDSPHCISYILWTPSARRIYKTRSYNEVSWCSTNTKFMIYDTGLCEGMFQFETSVWSSLPIRNRSMRMKTWKGQGLLLGCREAWDKTEVTRSATYNSILKGFTQTLKYFKSA